MVYKLDSEVRRNVLADKRSLVIHPSLCLQQNVVVFLALGTYLPVLSSR